MDKKDIGQAKEMNVTDFGLKAAILDMDGVITQTARVHKKAWKKMFNSYLEKLQDRPPLMEDEDYIKYIDGKPRYDGVKSFLASRGIELEYGSPDDSPDKETVCGLGNRKNNYFLELIDKDGVETYQDAVEKIKLWRKQGLKTAVVTSSKSCKKVLGKAGLLDLFDARIDGVTAIERKLEGKPQADIFLESTKELNISPSACMLFEDAISGVQAGTMGQFAFVVGVERNNNDSVALYRNGADRVIASFDELDINHDPEIRRYFTSKLPSLMSGFSKFWNSLDGKEPVLFFDYDGTLSPIVPQPEDAILTDDLRELLMKCSSKYTCAVVSGRDMDDVKSKVDIDEMIYAGSHGFRISGPNGLYRENEKMKEILPVLDEIEENLNSTLAKEIKGVKIDRKRYAIAVHYRHVDENKVPLINPKLNDLMGSYSGLTFSKGKMVTEIRPDVDWHKGKAIDWILNKLELADSNKYVPIYLGDDITDEDAFRYLSDKGIGVLVGFHEEDGSAAKYSLKNVYDVKLFLEKLLDQ